MRSFIHAYTYNLIYNTQCLKTLTTEYITSTQLIK